MNLDFGKASGREQGAWDLVCACVRARRTHMAEDGRLTWCNPIGSPALGLSRGWNLGRAAEHRVKPQALWTPPGA